MRMHERTPWTAAAVAALALGVASGARAQAHAEDAAPSASPAKLAPLYDRLAAGPLPDDVRSVFDHNRVASLEHHKPAFERCSGAGPAQVARPGGPGCCGHANGRRQGCGRCGHGGCGRAGGPPANEAKPEGPGR